MNARNIENNITHNYRLIPVVPAFHLTIIKYQTVIGNIRFCEKL